MEGEWLKSLEQIHLFDILRIENATLQFASYKERYQLLLQRFIISPNVKIIKKMDRTEDCLKILRGEDEHIEGLVFKAENTRGWPDTAIVRCLKKDLKILA